MLLRYYWRGLALLGTTVALIWYLVDYILSSGVVDKVNDVVYKALSGQVPADSASLERMLNLGPDPIGVEIASWAALACWVFGIVDSYRIGAKLDQAKPSSSRQTT